MIRQIEHVTEIQHIDNPAAKNCDVLGLYREADAVMIALLFFREGKLTGSEHFSFHLIASNDAEIVESFLLQHYKNLDNLCRSIRADRTLPANRSRGDPPDLNSCATEGEEKRSRRNGLSGMRKPSSSANKTPARLKKKCCSIFKRPCNSPVFHVESSVSTHRIFRALIRWRASPVL